MTDKPSSRPSSEWLKWKGRRIGPLKTIMNSHDTSVAVIGNYMIRCTYEFIANLRTVEFDWVEKCST